MGTLGKDKLRAVYDNSNYFRDSLIEMGCEVFGDVGSPVIPLMIYHPTKTTAFSRECLKRGLVRDESSLPLDVAARFSLRILNAC